jgi:hypothetical protein
MTVQVSQRELLKSYEERKTRRKEGRPEEDAARRTMFMTPPTAMFDQFTPFCPGSRAMGAILGIEKRR